MRGLKVRSADTLHDWSVALLGDVAAGGLTNYINTELAKKLNLAGGTLLGPLELAADATEALHPVTFQQFNNNLEPYNNAIIQLGNTKLDKAGGTMTGPLVLAGDATLPLHAVPLSQVQTLINDATGSIDLSGYARLAGATFTGPVVVPDAEDDTEALNLGYANTLYQGKNTRLTSIAGLPNGVGLLLAKNDGTVSYSTVSGDGTHIDVSLEDATYRVTMMPSGVLAASYTKVTVDEFGIVTEGSGLVEADLPTVLPVAGNVFDGTTALTIGAALDKLQDAIVAGGITQAQLEAYAQPLNVNLTNLAGVTPAGETFLYVDVAGNYRYVQIEGVNGVAIDLDQVMDTDKITIGLAASGVVAGTYTKITVDQYGRATLGAALTEADLPNVTPPSGEIFDGVPLSIEDAFIAVQTSVAAVAESINTKAPVAKEDAFVATEAQTVFPFTNVDGLKAAAGTGLLLVFVDGVRQKKSAYTIDADGITLDAALAAGIEVEVVQFA